jgi:uncharacterized protein (DUF1697 family)
VSFDRIALLRAINVGGHGKLPMAELLEHCASAGFKDAKTLLQSGNVVFAGKGKSPAQLERALEAKVGTDVMVRTAAEWGEIVAVNPFRTEAKNDPGHLLVMFLKSEPEADFAWPGPERMKRIGRQLYLVYPNGAGTSKLTGALIERKLTTRGTARNWNTVMKIAALLTSS